MEFDFDERRPDSRFVETIWRTHSEQPGTFTSPAVSHWEMVVTRYQGATTLTVRGPETRATPADGPADAEFVGITFKLGTFMPYMPVSKLVDAAVTLPRAARHSFWLQGSALDLPDFDYADVFVEKLVRDGLLVCDPVVNAVLRDEPHELSLRTAQRRFLNATGLTHNAVRQIERAKTASALLEGGLSIADVVYQTGYADQPHLTRSFKCLTGRTPAQVWRAGRTG